MNRHLSPAERPRTSVVRTSRAVTVTHDAGSETRDRVRFALEAAGVGTFEWDMLEHTVVWSDVQQRLHGMTPGTFGGTMEAFFAAVHPSDRERIRNEVARSVAQNTDRRFEYRVEWPDGSVRWIAMSGRSFHDEHGRPVRSAGIGMDITRQKELHERLLQAQKMEAVGNLAGGIAHDFNNLLTVIAGYCQLLVARRGMQADARRDLSEIRRAVDRASALTAQLLAFSRRQVLAPRVVNLNEIICNLRPMLRRLIEEHVQLEFRLTEDLALVNVDPGQMDQVLINLIVNARDAMPEGGIVTVETAVTTETAVTMIARGEGEAPVPPCQQVALSVTDTGQGIQPDAQRHIFEPFFTTKPQGEGTGLGLATVYGIVKQSGGSIFMESEPGIGTTFRLYFPVVSVQTEADTSLPKAAAGDLRGNETVLVVEDDSRLRALDERILKQFGYRVLVASTAAEALRICEETDEPIHAVLTDVIMPGGSGRTIADWVAEHRPDTKVIYMSGYAGNAITRHGILEAGTQFLQKPFSPDALARKLREALS
jgi:two-component system, cell cycle sensor histidine kinase and response regulator CckA